MLNPFLTKPHTIGIRSDYKGFKTRRKAEEYIAQPVTLGQTPLSNPDVVLYTDGSASLDPPSAGWGVFISRSLAPSASVWGLLEKNIFMFSSSIFSITSILVK